MKCKIFSRVSASILLFSILSGCNATLEKINKDLGDLNQSIQNAGQPERKAPQAPPVMASYSKQESVIRLVWSSDNVVKKASEDALPVIREITNLHRCMIDQKGLLHINKYAIPGLDMSKLSVLGIPNIKPYINYHDSNKCVAIRAIDQFSMPALNTLKFRTVYFSEESGETVNFFFTLRKTSDAGWLLSDYIFPQ